MHDKLNGSRLERIGLVTLVRYNEETVIFDKVLAIDPKNVLDLNSMYRNW